MAIIDQNKESLKQREQRIGYLRDKLDKLVNPAIRTEEEIFQELSMDYVKPECR